MTEQIHAALRPVRRRQRWQSAARTAALGLTLGSLLAVLLGSARVVGWSVSTPAVMGVLSAGTVLGFLVGYARGWSWHRTAVAVDTCYRLKDRAVTALAFSRSSELDESVIHQLQVVDALGHLRQVRAGEVVPLAVPKILPVALASLLVASVLLLVPRSEAGSVTTSSPHIEAAGKKLEETLFEPLRELSDTLPDSELGELLAQLEQLVVRLQEPDVDQVEALATLSEMQDAIAAARAEFNLEEVKAQLQALGEALAAAEAPEAAARALMEGDFDKAAELLEELDVSQLTRLESKTVAEKLEELAKEMEEARQNQLSEGARKMAEGLDDDNAQQAKLGAQQLAKVSRQQALRENLDQRLANQISQLAESKASARSSQDGGLAQNKPDRPSNTWGKGATGKPLGDEPTSIETERQRVDIAGTHGEGPSQRETTRVSEGSQTAERGYRDQYQAYRKKTEAVLQSEALPLGHRQVIRRYFERIHPDSQSMQDTRQAARPRRSN